MAAWRQKTARSSGRQTPFVAQAVRAARSGLDGLWRLYWQGDDEELAARIHLPQMGRVLQLEIAERRPLAAEHDLLRAFASLGETGDTDHAVDQLTSLHDTVRERILFEATAIRVHILTLRSGEAAAAPEVVSGAAEVGEALDRVVAAATERGHLMVIGGQVDLLRGRAAVAAARAALILGDEEAGAARRAEAEEVAGRMGEEERWWGHAFGAATWRLEQLLLAGAPRGSAAPLSAADRALLAPRQLAALGRGVIP